MNKSIAGGVGEAHSKLILSGEHAVVYGEPAIAIPFPLKVNVEIKKLDGDIKITSLLYTGIIDDMPVKMNGLSACIKEVLLYLNKPIKDLDIRILSEIPLGRGLGSSAAVATAVIRGIFSFYNKKLTNEELFYFVELAESYAHGKPSGIDMMAVASDTPIYFKKKEGVITFTPKKAFFLVVADSGEIGDTKYAVSHVREQHSKNPKKIAALMDRIGAITNEVKEHILSGEEHILGELLYHNHECLRQLGVSNERLDNLVEKAIKMGALGGKLTGGGMGGCMIALTRNEQDAKRIMKELIEAGALSSWYFATDKKEIGAFMNYKGADGP